MDRRTDATAGIVLIGDELLSGKVEDENARFLIQELRALGVSVRRLTVIPDVLAEIAATVGELAGRLDHVFTSGGVGPTHDDLTMEGIALAFGVEVIRHPELERLLRSYYGERLQERNLRMADVPKGAELVRSEHLAWPVVAMRNVFIFPGIPQLFRKKFDAIRERFRAAPFHLRRVFTVHEEGLIAAHLDQLVARFEGVQIGSYPRLDAPDYKVQVTLESKDPEAVEAATQALVALLGAAVVRVS